jgi:hypothetical protein
VWQIAMVSDESRCLAIRRPQGEYDTLAVPGQQTLIALVVDALRSSPRSSEYRAR